MEVVERVVVVRVERDLEVAVVEEDEEVVEDEVLVIEVEELEVVEDIVVEDLGVVVVDCVEEVTEEVAEDDEVDLDVVNVDEDEGEPVAFLVWNTSIWFEPPQYSVVLPMHVKRQP